MIRWIQSHNWFASGLLAAFSLLFLGGIDLFVSDFSSISVSLLFSLAIFTASRFAWISASLIAIGSVLAILLDVKPGANGLMVTLVLLLVAAFANQLQRLTAVVVAILSGTAVLANAVFFSDRLLFSFGIVGYTSNAQLSIFAFGFALLVSLNLLSWLLGRLLITRSTHVGTNFDRAVAERTQARLALEVAEQNQRFEIARDISELVIQRISAAISIAEGGVYAIKADQSSAARILEQSAESARSAHAELRRLFDMLNKLDQVNAAPPRIADLESLVIAFRELGYNIYLKHEGPRFEISEGAELAIYRIAFDALENVKKNTPLGTDVTVDFSWTESGMQLLIKDNGTEVANRGLSLEQLQYSAEEDRKALTESIRGAGITAMTERAALYGGSVEASRVPGVGFTVSAIFPNLKDTASE